MFCFSYSIILLSDFVEKMSLFKYFQRKEIPKEESLTDAERKEKSKQGNCSKDRSSTGRPLL